MNIENYETVKQRKKRFYADNPDGRIVVKLLETDYLKFVICSASCFRNKEDQEKNLPWATGYALEIRDTELSVSRKGEKYASVNYSSWLENCEESSVGRCLDNAGYAGKDTCSYEEMKKVDSITAESVLAEFPENTPNQPDVPFFDDLPSGTPKFKPGDSVPKEYWDNKKSPAYSGLWVTKTESGAWEFIKAGGTT